MASIWPYEVVNVGGETGRMDSFGGTLFSGSFLGTVP
jgi:hypothetical protein